MATTIHPTAIVDPSAEIADGVEIGPYCVIYAGVKIGAGTWLQNHVTVDSGTEIGERNRFFAFGSIGQLTQDLKYDGGPTYAKIGNDNTFREFCTVHRATSANDATIIGNHGNFLSYSHVAHDCIVGDNVILSNNGTLGGHVTVGDYAIISGLSAVHQFCRIGAHVLTGGCTKIVQDIPPFMIADGNPVRVRAINSVGMQRRGFTEQQIRCVKKAHRALYRDDNNATDALAIIREIDDPDGVLAGLIEFVSTTERGLH